ncbi:glycosyltransferase family 4 protein [Pollutimonas nitritireducens]|nr:glycosyltransferase family 4 protein [Pollutimonas nitritireducens]
MICYFPHQLSSRSRLKSIVKAVIKKTRSTAFEIRQSLNKRLPQFVAIAGAFHLEPNNCVWLDTNALVALPVQKTGTAQIPLWPKAYCGVRKVTIDGVQCDFQVSELMISITLPPGNDSHRIAHIESVPAKIDQEGPFSDGRSLGICIDAREILWMSAPRAVEQVLPPVTPIAALAAYSRIISISNFTSEWIANRWQLESTELQPPIDTDSFNYDSQKPRARFILSVGRFFAGGHNKKHREMAEAFIKMRKEGCIPDDWRLVLVGARHQEHQIHLDYFADLQKICEGHPIDIKADLPFAQLVEHYQTATIYWHAAGWGENHSDFPERLEHFGMTTCEAMACGCVPVVINAAGQKEIVNDGKNGYVFDDYDTLALHIKELTDPLAEPKLQELRLNARESVLKYARSDFQARVIKAFDGLAY